MKKSDQLSKKSDQLPIRVCIVFIVLTSFQKISKSCVSLYFAAKRSKKAKRIFFSNNDDKKMQNWYKLDNQDALTAFRRWRFVSKVNICLAGVSIYWISFLCFKIFPTTGLTWLMKNIARNYNIFKTKPKHKNTPTSITWIR